MYHLINNNTSIAKSSIDFTECSLCMPANNSMQIQIFRPKHLTYINGLCITCNIASEEEIGREKMTTMTWMVWSNQAINLKSKIDNRSR